MREDEPATSWLLLAALFALVALFAAAPIFAVDFFWQLELGKLITERRQIPSTDMFSSVHPDAPYVQFQWLWEVLAYGAFAAGGLGGVRAFQVLVLVVSFVLLWRSSRMLLPTGAWACAFCAVALVLFEDRFQARPSSTVLGFSALFLPWWLEPARRDRVRAWLWAGIVSCIWANVHSAESVLAPLAFAALALGSLLSRRAEGVERARRDAQLLVASCVGVLLCPWAGFAAIAPQLATGNKEFQPTYTMLENGLTPSYVLIALGPTLVTLLYGLTSWKRKAWSEWLLCGGMLVLSQWAVRNAFLCIVPLCAVLRRAPPRSTRPAYLLAVALLLVAFQDHVIQGYGGVARALQILPRDLAPDAFPEQLAEFMDEARIEGGAINDGRWGGYLIWRAWPRVHVFADSRQNFSAEMWPLFLASQRSDTRPAVLDEAFRRWGLELAIFRGPTFPLVTAPPPWQLLYKAGDQELYQHRDGAHARENSRRAQAWLAAKGGDPRQVGAGLWLAAHQRERSEAAALQSSAQPADQLEGLLLESKLLFEAGAYPETLRVVQRALALDPTHPQLLYRAALCAYVGEQYQAARQALARLQPSALSLAQRARVAVLAGALR